MCVLISNWKAKNSGLRIKTGQCANAEVKWALWSLVAATTVQQPNGLTGKHGQRQLKKQLANLKLRCPQLHLSRCQFVFLFLQFFFLPYKLGHKPAAAPSWFFIFPYIIIPSIQVELCTAQKVIRNIVYVRRPIGQYFLAFRLAEIRNPPAIHQTPSPTHHYFPFALIDGLQLSNVSILASFLYSTGRSLGLNIVT